MKMNRTTLPLIFYGMLLCALAMPSLLQADESGGGAAPYLRMGMGARALAMGNAATAATRDAAAAYWNPAALATLSQPSLASQTAVLGWEESWNVINACYPFHAPFGNLCLGAGLNYFSAGDDIEVRTRNRVEPSSIISDSESTLWASAAAEFLPGLGTGLNAKLLSHSLGEDMASGFGLDLAVWHQALPVLQWGIMIQDLYSSLTWDSSHVDNPPTQIRLGLAAPLPDQRLLVAVDLNLEFAGEPAGEINRFEYHAGAEYNVFAGLLLRLGWDFDRLTLGAGYDFAIQNFAQMRLDYAFASERIRLAGPTHLFSLSLGFPSFVSAPSTSPAAPSAAATDSQPQKAQPSSAPVRMPMPAPSPGSVEAEETTNSEEDEDF